VSNLHVLWSVVARDPYLLIGLLLLGVPGAVNYYLLRRLEAIGFTAGWWWPCVREYARISAVHGWPRWPLHALWLGLLVGIVFLLVGISKM
jgi:hypothetical protein